MKMKKYVHKVELINTHKEFIEKAATYGKVLIESDIDDDLKKGLLEVFNLMAQVVQMYSSQQEEEQEQTQTEPVSLHKEIDPSPEDHEEKEVIIAISLWADGEYDLNDNEQFNIAIEEAFHEQVFSGSYDFGLCDYVIVPDDVEDDDRWSLKHHKLETTD